VGERGGRWDREATQRTERYENPFQVPRNTLVAAGDGNETSIAMNSDDGNETLLPTVRHTVFNFLTLNIKKETETLHDIFSQKHRYFNIDDLFSMFSSHRFPSDRCFEKTLTFSIFFGLRYAS